MMQVFATQPPVHTEGHPPVKTGSAGQVLQCSAVQVVPPVQAYVDPQPPQLELSLSSLTQAPLHEL